MIAALIKDLNNVKKIKKDEYDYSIDLNYTDSGENYNYRNGTEISVNIYSEYKNTLKVLNDSGVLAKLEEQQYIRESDRVKDEKPIIRYAG